MLNKGFFKTLLGFSIIVLFSMVTFLLVGGYEQKETQKNNTEKDVDKIISIE